MKNNKSTTAIYTRTNSADKNPHQQIKRCRQALKEMGLVEHAVYQDQGASNVAENPSGLAKLLDAAEAGCFDTVIVADITRISRSATRLAEILKQLSSSNIRLISLKEQFDSETAFGKLIKHVLCELHRIHKSMGPNNDEGMSHEILNP